MPSTRVGHCRGSWNGKLHPIGAILAPLPQDACRSKQAMTLPALPGEERVPASIPCRGEPARALAHRGPMPACRPKLRWIGRSLAFNAEARRHEQAQATLRVDVAAEPLRQET